MTAPQWAPHLQMPSLNLFHLVSDSSFSNLILMTLCPCSLLLMTTSRLRSLAWYSRAFTTSSSLHQPPHCSLLSSQWSWLLPLSPHPQHPHHPHNHSVLNRFCPFAQSHSVLSPGCCPRSALRVAPGSSHSLSSPRSGPAGVCWLKLPLLEANLCPCCPAQLHPSTLTHLSHCPYALGLTCLSCPLDFQEHYFHHTEWVGIALSSVMTPGSDFFLWISMSSSIKWGQQYLCLIWFSWRINAL